MKITAEVSVDLDNISWIGDKIYQVTSDAVEESMAWMGDEIAEVEKRIILEGDVSYTGQLYRSVSYYIDAGDAQGHLMRVGPRGIRTQKLYNIYDGGPARLEPLSALIPWVESRVLLKEGQTVERTAAVIQMGIAGEIPGRPGGTSYWHYGHFGSWGFPFKELTLTEDDIVFIISVGAEMISTGIQQRLTKE